MTRPPALPSLAELRPLRRAAPSSAHGGACMLPKLLLPLLCAACELPSVDLEAAPADSPAFPPFGTSAFDASAGPAGPSSSTIATASPQPTVSGQSGEPMRPGEAEPTRDPAFVLMHGLTDAEFIYICPESEPGRVDAEAVPAPTGGLSYGQAWTQTEETFDFDAALSWWLVVSEVPLEQGVACGDVLALSEQGPRCPRTSGASADPVVDGEADAAVTLADAAVTLADAAVTLADAAFDADTHAADPRDSATDAALRRPTEADASEEPPTSSDASRVPGLDCVVGPHIAPFASFAAGSFSRARSSLLVAAGCFGPVTRTLAEVCGVSRATTQALRPYWVPLSRLTTFDALGLQFLNASTLGSAALRSSPEEGVMGAFFSVASDVGSGEIAPVKLNTGVKLSEVGSDLERVSLRVEEGFGSEPLWTQTWAETLDASPARELSAGSAYTVVLLGPVTAAAPRPIGNPVRLVLVSNDSARAAR